MLTTGAFNALLNTPVRRTTSTCYLFIATTEVHKIPATILSDVKEI